MIELKKLNGALVLVNPDLIRFIEATPDTILTFTDGTKLTVKDASSEIVQKIIDFRLRCRALSINDGHLEGAL